MTHWEALKGQHGWQIHEADPKNGWIANMKCDHCDESIEEAYANLIVTAVNSHDALLEALEAIVDYEGKPADFLKWGRLIRNAQATIKAAS